MVSRGVWKAARGLASWQDLELYGKSLHTCATRLAALCHDMQLVAAGPAMTLCSPHCRHRHRCPFPTSHSPPFALTSRLPDGREGRTGGLTLTVFSSSAEESPAFGFLERRGNTSRLVLYALSRLAFSYGAASKRSCEV